MTNGAKAIKAARNSRMVERHGASASSLDALVFDAGWWESLFQSAEQPALMERVRERLDLIEAEDLLVFPSVLYKAKVARKILQNTQRKMDARLFWRR